MSIVQEQRGNGRMNIIDAICNIINNPVTELQSRYLGRNRANSVGDALEEYVKDLFSGTFGITEEAARIKEWNKVFSYLGNNSNPPDVMLRAGDAIEVKKIESDNAALALNSSYPKHTLKSSSTMISTACRNSENWHEKDMIYAVGVVMKNSLQHFCMVYGLDYCASEECYSRIKTTIKNGVEAIQGIEFTESKELGHINRVDPLGITYMRVRGMWGITNPWNVFNYVYTRPVNKKTTFMCLINETKWKTFNNTDKLIDLVSIHRELEIKNVDIKKSR
jgi:hypothetical protein